MKKNHHTIQLQIKEIIHCRVDYEYCDELVCISKSK